MTISCKGCISAQQPQPSIWCTRLGCSFAEGSPACEHFELPAEESSAPSSNVCSLADARKRFSVIEGGDEGGETSIALRTHVAQLIHLLVQIRKSAHIGDIPPEKIPGAVEVRLAKLQHQLEQTQEEQEEARSSLAKMRRERDTLRSILRQIQGKRTSAAGAPYAHIGQALLNAIDAALGEQKPAKESAHA